MKTQHLIAILFLACLCTLSAQTSSSTKEQKPGKLDGNAAPTETLAALQLKMTNACQRVLEIVNRPVTAYRRAPNMRVSTYSPGWFHEGASKPDFNAVDVRQTRELIYAKSTYVTSDLNPGIVFLGQDLEFNSMNKWFYTNRSLPKRKLSEAEMLEINQLYRTIGRCENEIARLQAPPAAQAAQPAKDQTDAEQVAPGQAFGSIRIIPRQTRMLYGGIVIVGLILGLIVSRVIKRRSGV